MEKIANCRKEPYDVYIGRGSKWGNPFVIGPDGTRLEVIAKYETWIREQPDLMAALPELKDKILGCFCMPKPCHGSVLIRLLRELTNPEKFVEYEHHEERKDSTI